MTIDAKTIARLREIATELEAVETALRADLWRDEAGEVSEAASRVRWVAKAIERVEKNE